MLSFIADSRFFTVIGFDGELTVIRILNIAVLHEDDLAVSASGRWFAEQAQGPDGDVSV